MKFEVIAIIPAPAKEVFAAWLDSDQHSEMTGAIALVTPDEGDKFSAWDGYIWGTNLAIEPDSYIKQSWRTADFTENQENSLVEIYITDEGSKGCIVKIVHSDLRDIDEHYIKGWKDFYFTPMTDYFSNLD